jgi:three-Cys-motif partner protein
MCFIELNHADALRSNLSARTSNCDIISGKFEEHINEVLSKRQYGSVFLYVDPYGIKALDYSLFAALPNRYNTAELLINLNSFGFIREACRVMKVAFREKEDEIFSDLEEYDPSRMDSLEELNSIAGGTYWQEIIRSYKTGEINCYDAERQFSAGYKNALKQAYHYVLDMPIRLKQGQHPKYRMVHATNHPDGCILMADNIAKRTDRLVVEIQNSGQLALFEQNAENETISDALLESLAKGEIDKLHDFTSLPKFIAEFYNTYGALCGNSRLCTGKEGSILKTLEKQGAIIVKRVPATNKRGKSTFWSETKDHKIFVRSAS